MMFAFFALAIAAAFFGSSLILLNYGRHLGLRYLRQQKEAANMAGLTTVEGAVFALIGPLLAFTISGALQRFDERRQLVVQEANAASTAYAVGDRRRTAGLRGCQGVLPVTGRAGRLDTAPRTSAHALTAPSPVS